MSRIDRLLDEHCPEGVELRALADCIEAHVGGGTPSRSRAEYWNGDVQWASVGDITATAISISSTRQTITRLGLEESSSRLVPAGWVVVAVKIAPGEMRVVDREIAINQDLRALQLREEIDPFFLTYYFGTLNIVGNGTIVKGITTQSLLRTRVPVPPLEVQREIVRILDQFTQLEAELEAELEARQSQYRHYLRETVLPGGELEWTTLGEATINHDRKRRPVTRADRRGGEYPYYGANGVQDYVDDFIFDGTFLLVGEDGSVKHPDGTPILNWAAGKIWVNNHAHVLTAADERFDLRYLYYYLATIDVTTYVTGGTQPKINQRNLNRIPVPLVPRSYQDYVAGVLDRFDVLVSDVSIGLPAEIAARRKQYEYYRDKLLTFHEAAA